MTTLNADNKLVTKPEVSLNSRREGGLRARGSFKRSSSQKPLITVVTVVFNGEDYLEQTLLSVINQNYDEIEYIIVDGGSNDRTLGIIRKYESFVDYWVSEPDSGIYDAMNKAIRLTLGDYLLFMNAGDTFVDNESLFHLASIINTEASKEQVVYGGWLTRTNKGATVSKVPDLCRGLFNHQATLYSRSIHAWHGEYICARGLSAADFLFFRTLQASNRVTFHTTERIVAVIDPFGTSAGLQTYLQRELVDILCGYTGRYVGAGKIVIHPSYNRLKRLFTRR